MTIPDLNDDDLVLDRLRNALDGGDPVPGDAVIAARQVFELRRLDEDLAELIADSLLDAGIVVRREDPQPRLVSFELDGFTIDVELGADGRSVIGVVSPAGSLAVEIETAAGVTQTRTDYLGRFRGELGPGRVRLRVAEDDRTIVTPWITR